MDKESIKIIENEISKLNQKIKEIKEIEKSNKEIRLIKDLINQDNKKIIDINLFKLSELLEIYNLLNKDDIINDLKYIIYIYKYFYKEMPNVEFPQKITADKKYEIVKLKLTEIKEIKIEEYEEILNIYNRMNLVYNKLTKNIYTNSITEFDVINYIMKSETVSEDQKAKLLKDIEDYNEHINKIITAHEIETIKEKNSKEKEKAIDPYIKSYCEMLKVMDESEIVKNLPTSFMENCKYILNGIIDYIDCQKITNSKITKDKNVDINSSIIEENKKLDIIEKCVVDYLNKIIQEEELNNEFEDNLMINKIMYLNKYIYNDIKTITQEQYESLNSAIEALIKGDLSTNLAKHRKLKNNVNLKNVFEIKRDNTRLFYTPIGNNTYVVLLAGQKNVNNDSVLIGKAEKRISEYNNLSRNGLINVNLNIEEGIHITEEIQTILNEKKRKM